MGPYDGLSDICDGCMCDPDTGWGGFTDHRAGRHFNNDDERDEWYSNHSIDDDEYDPVGWNGGC